MQITSIFLWYVRSRFGTDQGSLFSVFWISLNARWPFKSQWIRSRKSCWIPYLFSEKFRNRHSKELLPGSSDSHEEKERNFLLLFWRIVSFSLQSDVTASATHLNRGENHIVFHDIQSSVERHLAPQTFCRCNRQETWRLGERKEFYLSLWKGQRYRQSNWMIHLNIGLAT